MELKLEADLIEIWLNLKCACFKWVKLLPTFVLIFVIDVLFFI